MKAKIISHKRGLNTQHNTQYLIEIQEEEHKNKKTAISLLGKKVFYKTSKGTISGRVSKAHGNKGIVIVTFEKGLPGTAISEIVEVNN